MVCKSVSFRILSVKFFCLPIDRRLSIWMFAAYTYTIYSLFVFYSYLLLLFFIATVAAATIAMSASVIITAVGSIDLC